MNVDILKSIASNLKDHDCKNMIKIRGKEISLTSPTVNAEAIKINIGLFSNQIRSLDRASNVAKKLDELQYSICKINSTTNDPTIKKNYQKLYLQIILALVQLQSIIEKIKKGPNPGIRKELEDWINYCDSLNGHVNQVITPGIPKGTGKYNIEEIMRYQNITENDMDEALRELEVYSDREYSLMSSPDTMVANKDTVSENIISENLENLKDIVYEEPIEYFEKALEMDPKVDDKIKAGAKALDKKLEEPVTEISPHQTQIERYPYARFPDQVNLGDIVPLEIIIKALKPSPSSKGITLITLDPKENEKEIPVQVIVECDDGFEIDGKYYDIINVPVELKDSYPVIFNIKSKKEGKHAIQIRFFQQTTYVGEIKLESLVISSENQPQLSVSHSHSQNKEWKSESAILENVFPGPDITIFIHERKISTDFEYDVLIFSSNTPIEEMGPIKFQFNPEIKFNKIFEDIENFIGDPTIIEKKIKAKGMSLYDELFPPSLKESYWERRAKIKSIRVISKEPWIPWEIIKPWRRLENGIIEEDPFLCEQYAFSRWMVGKPERIKGQIKNIKFVVPNDTNLGAAIKERNWVEEFAKSKNIKTSFDSSYDQVINTLETDEEIDILHFSTHGQNNKESPLLSTIELEGNIQFRPEEIVGKTMTFGQSYPIVILNACQTGNQGFSLTGIQGWATKFLDAGASVYIGTLWSVNDEIAFNFIQEMYNQLSDGISLGESVKNARNKSKQQGGTSWLAYQLYGHPNYKIKF
jgi:hypothetical protein